MNITKKILVLTLLQGLPPGLLCQKWEFPSKIVGLIGSCVEIPCTFYPHRNSRTSSTVWYLYHRSRYPQIFNSQGSSDVLMAYRGRTSLVHGSPSCSLRIDPVRKDDGDEYYPGIAEDRGTNAYSLNRMFLKLNVTDTATIPVIFINSKMFEGRPGDVTCSVAHTCGSDPPSLTWNKPGQTERRSEYLSGGYWREMSSLTYIPTQEDDKTQIQCTATYHNGGTSRTAATLDIRYAPKDVTVSLPENTAFVEGSDVILTCTSRSNPPPLRYEWYSTNSKIKLEPQDQKIQVLNMSKDTELFYCAATNDVGRGESPPTMIPVQYSDQYSSILLPILGVLAGVILLIIIVYFYKRNKTRQKSRHENLQRPDGTYTDLVKTEISKGYDTLQPSFPAPPAAGGKDLISDDQYENVQREKNERNPYMSC